MARRLVRPRRSRRTAAGRPAAGRCRCGCARRATHAARCWGAGPGCGRSTRRLDAASLAARPKRPLAGLRGRGRGGDASPARRPDPTGARTRRARRDPRPGRRRRRFRAPPRLPALPARAALGRGPCRRRGEPRRDAAEEERRRLDRTRMRGAARARRRANDQTRRRDPLLLNRFETIFGLAEMVNLNRASRTTTRRAPARPPTTSTRSRSASTGSALRRA